MLVKDYIKKHGDTHFQSVLTKKGKQKLSHPNWIITDMRFPNEFDAVKAKGGITIRVNRIRYISTHSEGEHESETALDNHNFDYVIDNNGSMSDLILKVREILTQNQIIYETTN